MKKTLSYLTIFLFLICQPLSVLALTPTAKPHLIPFANLFHSPANPAIVDGAGRLAFAYENIKLNDFPKDLVTEEDGYKATFSDIKQTGNSMAFGADFPVGEALTLSLGYLTSKVSLDREYYLENSSPSGNGNVEDSIDSKYSQPAIQLVALAGERLKISLNANMVAINREIKGKVSTPSFPPEEYKEDDSVDFNDLNIGFNYAVFNNVFLGLLVSPETGDDGFGHGRTIQVGVGYRPG